MTCPACKKLAQDAREANVHDAFVPECTHEPEESP